MQGEGAVADVAVVGEAVIDFGVRKVGDVVEREFAIANTGAVASRFVVACSTRSAYFAGTGNTELVGVIEAGET